MHIAINKNRRKKPRIIEEPEKFMTNPLKIELILL